MITLALMLTITSCGGSTGSSNTASGPRGTKIELSNKKTEITYFKAKTEMSVNSVTLDYYPSNGKVLSDPKKENNQFVRLDLSFKNTGTEKFKVNYTQVSVNGATAKAETQTSLINKGNSTDILETKELAPGETTSGAIYVEVPASETKDTLSVSYKGYDSESKQYEVSLK